MEATRAERFAQQIALGDSPLGYAVRRGDPDRVVFLNRWILLEQRDLTIQRLFDDWILGQEPPSDRTPRWSVLHDVLGWGGAKETAKSG